MISDPVYPGTGAQALSKAITDELLAYEAHRVDEFAEQGYGIDGMPLAPGQTGPKKKAGGRPDQGDPRPAGQQAPGGAQGPAGLGGRRQSGDGAAPQVSQSDRGGPGHRRPWMEGDPTC